MHFFVVALLAGVLVGRVKVHVRTPRTSSSSGSRFEFGLQVEDGALSQASAKQLNTLATTLFCRVLWAGYYAHVLHHQWHATGSAALWLLALFLGGMDCLREVALVVWPALKPSHFLSHGRTAHRAAVATMVVSKLGFGLMPGPSAAQGIHHLIGTAMQGLFLILNQDEVPEYATQAGLLVVSAFVCHAWALAHQVPAAGMGAQLPATQVDWPEEVLCYLALFCGLMLVHSAWTKLVTPHSSSSPSPMRGHRVSMTYLYRASGGHTPLPHAPGGTFTQDLQADRLSTFESTLGLTKIDTHADLLDRTCDSLAHLLTDASHASSENIGPARQEGMRQGRFSVELPKSVLSGGTRTPPTPRVVTLEMNPLFKFKLVLARITCLSIFAAFALVTAQHLLKARKSGGGQAAWAEACRIWPSAFLVPAVLVAQMTALVMLLVCKPAFYMKHISLIRAVVYYGPLITRLLMLLVEPRPAEGQSRHIAVSMNPSTFIYFALSSLAHEDGVVTHLKTTLTAGLVLLLAKAQVLGLLPTFAWSNPWAVWQLLPTLCNLLWAHPSYITATLTTILAYPLVSHGQTRRATGRSTALQHASEAAPFLLHPQPGAKSTWGPTMSRRSQEAAPIVGDRPGSNRSSQPITSHRAGRRASWRVNSSTSVERTLDVQAAEAARQSLAAVDALDAPAVAHIISTGADTTSQDTASGGAGPDRAGAVSFSFAPGEGPTSPPHADKARNASLVKFAANGEAPPAADTDRAAQPDEVDGTGAAEQFGGDEWHGVISAPVKVNAGDIGVSYQPLASWMLTTTDTVDTRRPSYVDRRSRGQSLLSSQAAAAALQGVKGAWWQRALGLGAGSQLRSRTVHTLGCWLLVIVRCTAAWDSVAPLLINAAGLPAMATSTYFTEHQSVFRNPGSGGSHALLPLLGHVLCIGYSLAILGLCIGAHDRFIANKAVLWVTQFCVIALLQQLSLHGLSHAAAASAKEASRTPQYLSHPVLSMFAMSVMWPMMDLQLVTYKVSLLLRLTLTVVMSCVFVLDRCVVEPQIVALVALRTLSILVLAYVVSHEAVFTGPRWVNRLAAANQLRNQRPGLVTRVVTSMLRSRDHASCVLLAILMAVLALPVSEHLSSTLLSLDSPTLRLLHDNSRALLLQFISSSQRGTASEAHAGRHVLPGGTDALVPKELLGPIMLLAVCLLAVLLFKALDLVSTSELQRQHWYEEQVRVLQFLSEQRLDVLAPQELVEVMQEELPSLWRDCFGGLVLLSEGDAQEIDTLNSAFTLTTARAATLAPLHKYLPVSLTATDIANVASMLLRCRGEVVTVPDIPAALDDHPCTTETSLLAALRQHMHVNSLCLVPITANGTVVGGFLSLSPDPGAHDLHFVRSLKSLSSIVSSAMMLSQAMQDVRAGDLIIEDVMPRQVADMLKRQANAALAASSDLLLTSTGSARRSATTNGATADSLGTPPRAVTEPGHVDPMTVTWPSGWTLPPGLSPEEESYPDRPDATGYTPKTTTTEEALSTATGVSQLALPLSRMAGTHAVVTYPTPTESVEQLMIRSPLSKDHTPRDSPPPSPRIPAVGSFSRRQVGHTPSRSNLFANSKSANGAASVRSTHSLSVPTPPRSGADSMNGAKPAPGPLNGQVVYQAWHESVTVLFCDIVGYTSMSQELEPEQVMMLLHELFTKYDRLADELGVYKVETIGDCYMACTGVTTADDKHAETLLSFAINMVHAAASVTNPHTGGPVRVRVGLHSGRVMSGIVGLHRARYCLFGDTVNTASRMESTGLPEMLQVSEATYRCLDPTTQQKLQYRGEIEVKGKGLMKTYLLNTQAPETAPSVSGILAVS